MGNTSLEAAEKNRGEHAISTVLEQLIQALAVVGARAETEKAAVDTARIDAEVRGALYCRRKLSDFGVIIVLFGFNVLPFSIVILEILHELCRISLQQRSNLDIDEVSIFDLDCCFMYMPQLRHAQVERRHLETAVDESIKTLTIAGENGPPSASDDLQVNRSYPKYLVIVYGSCRTTSAVLHSFVLLKTLVHDIVLCRVEIHSVKTTFHVFECHQSLDIRFITTK